MISGFRRRELPLTYSIDGRLAKQACRLNKMSVRYAAIFGNPSAYNHNAFHGSGPEKRRVNRPNFLETIWCGRLRYDRIGGFSVRELERNGAAPSV